MCPLTERVQRCINRDTQLAVPHLPQQLIYALTIGTHALAIADCPLFLAWTEGARFTKPPRPSLQEQTITLAGRNCGLFLFGSLLALVRGVKERRRSRTDYGWFRIYPGGLVRRDFWGRCHDVDRFVDI